jgi:hypothetical protein
MYILGSSRPTICTFFCGAGIKLRTLYILGNCSATELHPQSNLCLYMDALVQLHITQMLSLSPPFCYCSLCFSFLHLFGFYGKSSCHHDFLYITASFLLVSKSILILQKKPWIFLSENIFDVNSICLLTNTFSSFLPSSWHLSFPPPFPPSLIPSLLPSLPLFHPFWGSSVERS